MHQSATPAAEFADLQARLPALAAPQHALYAALWRTAHLPGEALELCRLRLAQLHGNSSEWARSDLPLTQARREALRDWHRDPLISDAERACLAFAEVYAMDAQALTDELADAVKAHHGDAGLVLLIEALGQFDARARLGLLWARLGVDLSGAAAAAATGEG